jgi:phage shock protein PspC (stress-responsive transcriptional regulator)
MARHLLMSRQMFRHQQMAPHGASEIEGKFAVSTATSQTLFNRPDTLFGVCEGIGREFGFHPNWLRIGLAIPMIWNPAAVIGGYAGLGAALWLSHKIAPNRRRHPAPAEPATDTGKHEMALAA